MFKNWLVKLPCDAVEILRIGFALSSSPHGAVSVTQHKHPTRQTLHALTGSHLGTVALKSSVSCAKEIHELLELFKISMYNLCIHLHRQSWSFMAISDKEFSLYKIFRWHMVCSFLDGLGSPVVCAGIKGQKQSSGTLGCGSESFLPSVNGRKSLALLIFN